MTPTPDDLVRLAHELERWHRFQMWNHILIALALILLVGHRVFRK